MGVSAAAIRAGGAIRTRSLPRKTGLRRRRGQRRRRRGPRIVGRGSASRRRSVRPRYGDAGRRRCPCIRSPFETKERGDNRAREEKGSAKGGREISGQRRGREEERCRG